MGCLRERLRTWLSEEGLHVWGLEDINSLMKTYGRYPILL